MSQCCWYFKSKRSEHGLASWFGDSIDCSSPLPSGCFQWWHWQNSLMILSLTHYSLPQLCHTLTILIENSELCRQSNVGEGWVIRPSVDLFHKLMDWWKVKIHPPTHFHGWKARMNHSSIHLFIHLSICRLSGYIWMKLGHGLRGLILVVHLAEMGPWTLLLLLSQIDLDGDLISHHHFRHFYLITFF